MSALDFDIAVDVLGYAAIALVPVVAFVVLQAWWKYGRGKR